MKQYVTKKAIEHQQENVAREYFRYDVTQLFLWCYAASWWMVLAWIWICVQQFADP
jgi:hypothetical protein